MFTGNFFGQTNKTLNLDGITLTKTIYTHDYVDWHYHQNAYFTFILCGGLIETDRKKTIQCGPGDLLFHYWQESHSNIKPPVFTEGFHIEIESAWFEKLQIRQQPLEGSFSVTDPAIRLAFYGLVKEMINADSATKIAIESSIVNILSRLSEVSDTYETGKPRWVGALHDYLQAHPTEHHSLVGLSSMLGLHPVHLSRDFSKHFGISLSLYIRQLRLQKAMVLLQDSALTLTEVSHLCGFSDQSHFIRCFKNVYKTNPRRFLHYIKH